MKHMCSHRHAKINRTSYSTFSISHNCAIIGILRKKGIFRTWAVFHVSDDNFKEIFTSACTIIGQAVNFSY